ncbi:hypothetical protein LIER_26754 [Lithospermum erythrorhizon]|uniref:Uncharacterized protein n=1 Tax=Lithospermum erythrorhizon TaxID=34254 RepID=A0AAV3RDJ7_LITER
MIQLFYLDQFFIEVVILGIFFFFIQRLSPRTFFQRIFLIIMGEQRSKMGGDSSGVGDENLQSPSFRKPSIHNIDVIGLGGQCCSPMLKKSRRIKHNSS